MIDARRRSVLEPMPLRRLGTFAFGFFLLKGLAWLAIPWWLLQAVP